MEEVYAPPTQATAPVKLTAEDAAIIQAEKRMDVATREQLVEMYGESRGEYDRRVHLTRPRGAGGTWTCPQCRKPSSDIRRVCGNCLAIEPGFLRDAQQQQQQAAGGGKKGKKARESNGNGNGNDASASRAQLVVLRPATCSPAALAAGEGAAVQPHTQRCYRVCTAPAADPAKPKREKEKKKAQLPAAADAYADDEEEEDGDDNSGGGDVVLDGSDDWSHSGDDGEAEEAGVYADEPDCRAGGGAKKNKTAARTEAERAAAAGAGPAFTHFVSIPVAKTPEAAARASQLLDEVRAYAAAAPASSGLTPEMVAPAAARLHVTLLMLTLPHPQDVAFAVDLLHSAFAPAWEAAKAKHHQQQQQKQQQSHPRAALGALTVMPGGPNNTQLDPRKAAVVYLPPADAPSAATIALVGDTARAALAELTGADEHHAAEAAKCARLPHVTVVNKKWRRQRGAAATRPFDARELVERFAGRPLGEVELPCVELNRLAGLDGETGAHVVEASIPL